MKPVSEQPWMHTVWLPVVAKAMGRMGGEDAEFYAGIRKELQNAGKLGQEGVEYNPYEWLQVEVPLLTLVADGQLLSEAGAGDRVRYSYQRPGSTLNQVGRFPIPARSGPKMVPGKSK